MATTLTPQLQLNLPEVGASRDTWGTLLNDNFTDLDEFVSMAMPIGAILDFAGPNAPAGWLICDGRQISRITYSALFAVISDHWGAGDGSTTFNLPNANGRAGIGPGLMIDANGGSYAFSFTETAGAVTQFIQLANLPSVTMATDQQGYHAHTGFTGNAGGHGHTTDSQGIHDHNNPPNTGTGGTVPAGGHTLVANADLQGYHAHNVWVPQAGNAQAGSYSVWAPAAGMTYIQTDYNPAHSHNITITVVDDHNNVTYNAVNDHQHFLYFDGQHTHNISIVGDHSHTITSDGLHYHYVTLPGGGSPMSVLTPVLVVTKIIYAGKQASPYIAGVVVAPSALETADELAAIRQELAELRALFAPPRQRQIAAPMRGTH